MPNLARAIANLKKDKAEKVDRKAPRAGTPVLVTWAQNATDINEQVWSAMLQFVDLHQAELLVVAGHYTRSFVFDDRDMDWYEPRLAKYLLKSELNIGNHLSVLGDLNVLASARRPLSGIYTVHGGNCLIVGHPKLELTTCPTYDNVPRLAVTTGAVTYSNALGKVGYQAAQMHTFGGVFVETMENGQFRLRHVIWDGQGLVDMGKQYRPDGSVHELPVDLRLSDIHWPHTSEKYLAATAALAREVQAETVILDDVLNFDYYGHHERNNPFRGLPEMTVREQVEGCAKFVNELSEIYPGEVVVLNSNHHSHLDRWLAETDWREDLVNAEFYLEAAAKKVRFPEEDVFSQYVEGVEFLQEYQRFGVMHVHGDKGPNGVRGSAAAMARIGIPLSMGHVHSPCIFDRVFANGVGVEKGALAYARNSASGWLQTAILHTPNATRQMLIVLDGQY